MARLNGYLLLFLLSIASLFSALRSSAERGQAAEVARGRYLVNEVARCGECHTPQDAAGNVRGEARLPDAPVRIRPGAPIVPRAAQAPALAGLPGVTGEQALRVLEQGVGPEGETLRPPTHAAHMKREDARAVIAYLKSLRDR